MTRPCAAPLVAVLAVGMVIAVVCRRALPTDDLRQFAANGTADRKPLAAG